MDREWLLFCKRCGKLRLHIPKYLILNGFKVKCVICGKGTGKRWRTEELYDVDERNQKLFSLLLRYRKAKGFKRVRLYSKEPLWNFLCSNKMNYSWINLKQNRYEPQSWRTL